MIEPVDVLRRRLDGGTGQVTACQVLARLRSSSYPDIRRLNCDLADGTLTVRGKVTSFYLKQVALALVLHAAEVDRFDDQIHVSWRPDDPRS